jgi:gas vesicle protein
MNEETRNTGSSMLVPLLLGAVAGAVLVALTTPKSGPELRSDIKGLGRRVKGGIGNRVKAVQEAWAHVRDGSEFAMADLNGSRNEGATDSRT